MRWLHLSDIHVVLNNAGQNIAIQEMVKIIKSETAGQGQIDAVFITGDLTYSGSENEFKLFKECVLGPLRKIPEISNSLFFSVPGNHDLDCSIGSPLLYRSLPYAHQQYFFEESERGRLTRKTRADSFSSYSKFIAENGLIGPDPLREVSSLWNGKLGSHELFVVGMNTAFFSDKERDHPEKGELPVPALSLRGTIRDIRPGSRIILLGHHPLHWFKHEHKEPFKSLMHEHGILYLHGHEHEFSVEFGHDGLRIMGLGAGFCAPLDGTREAPYTNTVTICELGEMLNVKIVEWNAETGTWISKNSVPSDCRKFWDKSTGTFALRLPDLHGQGTQEKIAVLESFKANRAPPEIKEVISLGLPSIDAWIKLIGLSRSIHSSGGESEPDVLPSNETGGAVFIVFNDGPRRHLVQCIPGVGHIISRGEVEAANTRMDAEGYNAYSIITFGKIGEEARDLLSQLEKRKEIEVKTSENIAADNLYYLSEIQIDHLENLDAGNHIVILLISDSMYYLLVADKYKVDWFYIIDNLGNEVPSNSGLVDGLRDQQKDFQKCEYGREKSGISSPSYFKVDENSFDKESYLARCYSEYNTIRYAGLASVGFRTKSVTLEQIYVDARADIGADPSRNEVAAQQINDFVSSMQVSDQIKSQMLRGIQGEIKSGKSETARARALYQQNGSVLVTGDPGSGKTCFIKREILAYCRPTDVDETWYGQHIPVLVSLSEAAEHLGGDAPFIETISKTLKKRGFLLPHLELESLGKSGRVAFFLDGLDEVVSVERRTEIVSHVNSLIDTYGPLGCRFILTSRPAAVKLVDITPKLKQLELRGLSQQEMRTLASRVVATKVIAEDGNVKLDADSLSSDDVVLINRLLIDCEENPAIGRLAQNPLLLTLLMLIYINSGAPSAKRHLIYAQAVQTLASVRSRETGQQIVSEQDLRELLGAVALFVFRNSAGALPCKADVARIFSEVMAKQRGEPVSILEAMEHIQIIAESTGLLILNGAPTDDPSDVIITFMHHSFLEYYAAIGLSQINYEDMLREICGKMRWSEVTTLLSAIIGQTQDISGFLRKVILQKGDTDDFTGANILFAYDCALECDVPSDAAHRVLLRETQKIIISGPGVHDYNIREEFGMRLGKLRQAGRSRLINEFFISGMGSPSPLVVGAYIEMLGHCLKICEEIEPEVVAAYNKAAAAAASPRTFVAVCNALVNSTVLRTPDAENVLARALTANQEPRYAALSAMLSVTPLASRHWDELLKASDDGNRLISSAACAAILRAGLDANIISAAADRRNLLLKSLIAIQRSQERISQREIRVRVDLETVDVLLTSHNIDDRLLGLRLLPWLSEQGAYVHDRLANFLSADRDRRENIAALNIYEYHDDLVKLIEVSDYRQFQKMLKSKTRDVRISACSVFGKLAHYPRTLEVLEAYLKQHGEDDGEYSNCLLAICECFPLNRRVVEVIRVEFAACLTKEGINKERGRVRAHDLMRSIRAVPESANSDIRKRIMRIAEDFKIVTPLRREAFLTWASCCAIQRSSVETIVKFLTRPPAGFEGDSIRVAHAFVRQCRRQVAEIPEIRDSIPGLIRVLGDKYSAVLKATEEVAQGRIPEIRSCIADLGELLDLYEEIIG